MLSPSSRFLSHPRLTLELLVASFFANFLALASPLFVIQVLNRYVAYGVDETLATLTSGVILAIALELAFRHARSQLVIAPGAELDRELDSKAISLLTGVKSAALEQVPAGFRRELINGVDNYQKAFTPANMVALLDAPFALVFLGTLFLLSPVLGGIAMLFMSVALVGIVATLAALRRPNEELLTGRAQRNRLYQSATGAIDTVRAFNAAIFLRNRWEEESERLRRLHYRLGRVQGLLQSSTQTIHALMATAIIAVGAKLVVDGDLDVGAMIGANILAARALAPLVRLGHLSEAFSKARQTRNTIKAFSQLPVERTRGAALDPFHGGITFQDVAFSYPDSRTPVFESLSFSLHAGDLMVVGGTNGAGKTTLARLIVGLLEPTRGKVLVDGVDLQQIVPEWWRRQVAYLPQEPKFLNATIRENLLAFQPGMHDRQINELIGLAGLRRFIDENSEGLDAALHDHGENLPLGIRRRLALARALASNAVLFVVDEPTEGLDQEGLACVFQAINRLSERGSTVIALSHDPPLLESARFRLDLDSKPVPQISEG